MWSKLVDLGALIELRDCVAGLTKSDFAAYDEGGRLLLPPLSYDPIIEAFASAKEEQGIFLKAAIEKAALRKGPSLAKGPLNQYHAFIPIHAGDRRLVLA